MRGVRPRDAIKEARPGGTGIRGAQQMMAMIKKQLLQAGILLGMLAFMMVLGGIFEGTLNVFTGLCVLMALGAGVYGLTLILSGRVRSAKCVRTGRTAQRGGSRCDCRPEGLQAA